MAAEQTQAIAGGCHCGNLRFELQWPAGAEEMPARACGCSFCTKHGGVWTSHPAALLVLRIADPAEATRYRFGTCTADFHVCRAVPAVTCALEGRTYAVVNVNCLDGVDPATLDRVPTDFEGETVADRLARRRARWIAVVTQADVMQPAYCAQLKPIDPPGPRLREYLGDVAEKWRQTGLAGTATLALVPTLAMLFRAAPAK